jgi:hypothetical protein
VQGPIAQAAALTIFGNDVLNGVGRDNFWPDSTVFQFCKTVSFVILSGQPTAPDESLFAEDPASWISKLKDEGTVGLRLHCGARNDPNQDRMTVGLVGGGGRWLVEAVRHSASDLWEASWTVQNQNAPDRKIWTVVYYRVGVNRTPINRPIRGARALRAELQAALLKLEEFSTRQDLDSWVSVFRRANDSFDAENPLAAVYHSDIAPSTRLSLEAKRLLGAVQSAWVFGGMGSWNDLVFEGQVATEYDVLSNALYANLVQALCEAANEGFAG